MVRHTMRDEVWSLVLAEILAGRSVEEIGLSQRIEQSVGHRTIADVLWTMVDEGC